MFHTAGIARLNYLSTLLQLNRTGHRQWGTAPACIALVVCDSDIYQQLPKFEKVNDTNCFLKLISKHTVEKLETLQKIFYFKRTVLVQNDTLQYTRISVCPTLFSDIRKIVKNLDCSFKTVYASYRVVTLFTSLQQCNQAVRSDARNSYIKRRL